MTMKTFNSKAVAKAYARTKRRQNPGANVIVAKIAPYNSGRYRVYVYPAGRLRSGKRRTTPVFVPFG